MVALALLSRGADPSGVVPSKKVTVPVGAGAPLPLSTVAVNVTDAPNGALFRLDDTLTVSLKGWAAISQAPRPCVPMRTLCVVFCICRSNTATRGKPVPYAAHVAPPSVEAKTPISVPAYRYEELKGSTAKAFTGTSGRPLEALLHVGRAVVLRSTLRFVVFQICDRKP